MGSDNQEEQASAQVASSVSPRSTSLKSGGDGAMNVSNLAELAEIRRGQAERLRTFTSVQPQDSDAEAGDDLSFEEEDGQSCGDRRLGSFDPARPSQGRGATPDHVLQAHARSEEDKQRESQHLRALRLQATLDRLSRPLDETPSLIPSISSGTPLLILRSAPSNTPDTSTIDSTPNPPTPTTLDGTPFTPSALTPTTPLAPLTDLFAERKLRLEQQQKAREIAERIEKKQMLAQKEAKRNAILSPQEQVEKQIKEKHSLELKNAKAAKKAEEARIKRNIEDDKLRRKEKEEVTKAKRARERAAREASEVARLRAHNQMKQQMEDEEKAAEAAQARD